jgi:hypothetical protein
MSWMGRPGDIICISNKSFNTEEHGCPGRGKPKKKGSAEVPQSRVNPTLKQITLNKPNEAEGRCVVCPIRHRWPLIVALIEQPTRGLMLKAVPGQIVRKGNWLDRKQVRPVIGPNGP